MSDISKLAREVLESDSTDTWEWRDAARQLATAYLEQQSYIDTYKVGAETIIKRLREALEAIPEWLRQRALIAHDED